MPITSFMPKVRALFAVAASLGLTILPAVAQEFPSKAVSIVVPMSAGGQADILARSLAQEMGKYLHQGVVVVNRDGAAGTLCPPSLSAKLALHWEWRWSAGIRPAVEPESRLTIHLPLFFAVVARNAPLNLSAPARLQIR